MEVIGRFLSSVTFFVRKDNNSLASPRGECGKKSQLDFRISCVTSPKNVDSAFGCQVVPLVIDVSR